MTNFILGVNFFFKCMCLFVYMCSFLVCVHASEVKPEAFILHHAVVMRYTGFPSSCPSTPRGVQTF